MRCVRDDFNAIRLSKSLLTFEFNNFIFVALIVCASDIESLFFLFESNYRNAHVGSSLSRWLSLAPGSVLVPSNKPSIWSIQRPRLQYSIASNFTIWCNHLFSAWKPSQINTTRIPILSTVIRENHLRITSFRDKRMTCQSENVWKSSTIARIIA